MEILSIVFIVLFIISLFVIFFMYSYNNPYIFTNNTRKGNKNHDFLKHKHSSRSGALAEVKRMKDLDYPNSEKLNAYQNPENKYWYVGKSSW
jgi:hypothetical protein